MFDQERSGPAAISLQEVCAITFRRRFLLLAAGAIPIAIAVAAIFLLTPRYAASASVMVKTGREYLVREEGQVTGQSAPQTTKLEAVNSEIEIMTNRASIEQVIERIGIGRLYPAILRSPPAEGTPMDAAIQQFDRRLKVTGVKISNVIDISFSHRDKVLAATVLAEFLRVYNARHLAVFSNGDLSHLYANAISADVAELDHLQRRSETIRLGTGVFDANEQRVALIAQRKDAEDQRRQAIDRQQILLERMAVLRTALGSIPAKDVSTETDRGDADNALIELQRTRSDLLTKFGPEHPAVRSVEAQIASFGRDGLSAAHPFVHVRTDRSPIEQQVSQELVMDRAELAPLDGQIARAEAAVGSDDAELRRIETGDTELRTLASRIDSVSENLKQDRSQYQKARALDGMDAARSLSVSVIQQPIVDGLPVFPNPLIFGAGGIVLGLLASSGLLILLVLTNDRVLTAASIERALGLRVLASLPDPSWSR